jgi:hypothetical protein
MADDTSAQPKNIQEFDQIAVVIFSQPYNAHPYEKTLDVAEIASVLGMTPATTYRLLLLIKRPVEPRGSPQSRLGLTSITAKQSLMIEADQAYHRD